MRSREKIGKLLIVAVAQVCVLALLVFQPVYGEGGGQEYFAPCCRIICSYQCSGTGEWSIFVAPPPQNCSCFFYCSAGWSDGQWCPNPPF